MKVSSFLAALLVFQCILAPEVIFAQSANSQKTPDIVTEISTASEGEIEVEIPADLLQKILLNQDTPKKPTPSQASSQRGGYGRTDGFRIQVFSDGRNQHSLEARAKARGSAIIARFPKYRGQVYTQSSSPNWYTRIGNFQTSAEANAALSELKRAFPQFSSEMRVVKSKIIVAQ